MMKTLIVAGLLVLGLFAASASVEAEPLPCTAEVGASSGYVACCEFNVSASYGGEYRCVPDGP